MKELLPTNDFVDQAEAAIEIKNLHKTFGTDNHVLKGINLSLNKGEDLVILGKSGTGKSITIKCIVGLIEADEGEIKILGQDISKRCFVRLYDCSRKFRFYSPQASY